MANRIYDNIIAVDSSMGNLPIAGGASSQLTTFEIIGITFTAENTLGRCVITVANTLDILADFGYVNAGSGIISALQSLAFSNPLRVSSIKCPTLTAGSARIYLA